MFDGDLPFLNIDPLEMAQIALEETKIAKDKQISSRDQLIADQKQKMEEMALEFGDMLKVRKDI